MRFLPWSIYAFSALVLSADAAVVPFRSPLERRLERTREMTMSPVRLEPNVYCLDASVFEFAVAPGFRKLPAASDYCAQPAERLPREAIALLARIGEIHKRYAAAFGLAEGDLFGFGARLRFAPHAMGPLASETGDEIEMGAFPDFRASVFPDRIYAHELTHWLLREGKLGRAASALHSNYLFVESFPDLVASLVTQSVRIGFTDPSVRASLTLTRSGSPVRSMRRPLVNFAVESQRKKLVDACKTATGLTANERGLCAYFRAEHEADLANHTLYSDAREAPPTAAELRAPFRPESCLVHYRDGTAGLDACFKNALGPVLISFMHTIIAHLGERPLVSLLAAIDSAGAESDTYACAFTGATARARVPALEAVTVPFASTLRAFAALRDGLDEAGRTAYDRAWKSHALDAWESLERFDRETVVRSFAYAVLVQSNAPFSAAYGCESEIPSLRGPKCAATCTYIPALTSP